MGRLISDKYKEWKAECEQRFQQLKANEEELNRIFIDIYGLQDELTPDVEDKDVTVHRVYDTKDDVPESMRRSAYLRTMRDEIVSLLSYAVGCMFGRYSLDVDGLVLAGQKFESRFIRAPHGVTGGYIPTSLSGWYIRESDDSVNIKVCTFAPDPDNIIPILDDDYFEDDILGKFVKFISDVYGEDTLDENLKFIADALGGRGTPREVIRSYFLNDFYTDHLKTYQKRPIYWLFDSGKKDGFKALIYMHRYERDTLARMRTDYVHEQQALYRAAIENCNRHMESASGSDRVRLGKQLQKLAAQSKEIDAFEEKLHHYADMMIDIDLDDGVKHNYAIFGDLLAPIK